MRNNSRNSSIVKSVIRASDVLKSLADGTEKLTDISNRLNLNKTTTYRLLKTLVTSGFVVQDSVTRRYYLGPLVVCLASNPNIAHQRLIVYAFDDIKYLRDLSGESVNLQIKVGAQRVVLEELVSGQNVRYTRPKGYVLPLHVGSGGKVLLSELPDAEKQMILSGTKLVAMETNKIIDKEALENELKRIKREGYAVTCDETMQGGVGISVPIKDYVCPATLSIYGPKERFQNRLMDFLQELKESADRISRKLRE